MKCENSIKICFTKAIHSLRDRRTMLFTLSAIVFHASDRLIKWQKATNRNNNSNNNRKQQQIVWMELNELSSFVCYFSRRTRQSFSIDYEFITNINRKNHSHSRISCELWVQFKVAAKIRYECIVIRPIVFRPKMCLNISFTVEDLQMLRSHVLVKNNERKSLRWHYMRLLNAE